MNLEKFIVIFLFLINFLFAHSYNSSNKNIDDIIKLIDSENLTQKDILYTLNELNRIKYQTQFIELNNSIATIDTDNEKLKKDIETLDIKIDKILNQTIHNHKIELEEQEKRYEYELENQMSLFYIILSLSIFIGFALSWIGYRELLNYIDLKVKLEIEKNHKQIVNSKIDSKMNKAFDGFGRIKE
jgi:hypothetical protein